MIKIKEIEIQTPKWWQTGLILIAIVGMAIIIVKVPLDKVLKILEHALREVHEK